MCARACGVLIIIVTVYVIDGVGRTKRTIFFARVCISDLPSIASPRTCYTVSRNVSFTDDGILSKCFPRRNAGGREESVAPLATCTPVRSRPFSGHLKRFLSSLVRPSRVVRRSKYGSDDLRFGAKTCVANGRGRNDVFTIKPDTLDGCVFDSNRV